MVRRRCKYKEVKRTQGKSGHFSFIWLIIYVPFAYRYGAFSFRRFSGKQNGSDLAHVITLFLRCQALKWKFSISVATFNFPACINELFRFVVRLAMFRVLFSKTETHYNDNELLKTNIFV